MSELFYQMTCFMSELHIEPAVFMSETLSLPSNAFHGLQNPPAWRTWRIWRHSGSPSHRRRTLPLVLRRMIRRTPRSYDVILPIFSVAWLYFQFRPQTSMNANIIAKDMKTLPMCRRHRGRQSRHYFCFHQRTHISVCSATKE